LTDEEMTTIAISQENITWLKNLKWLWRKGSLDAVITQLKEQSHDPGLGDDDIDKMIEQMNVSGGSD